MYFPLPAESAPKGMGAPLLKIFAEAKYFNPELFFGDCREKTVLSYPIIY